MGYTTAVVKVPWIALQRKTHDYRHVWVNEDLGQMSKKKRDLVRLISKKAMAENIDCRTGKYSIAVKGVKYDGSTLEDLPAPIQRETNSIRQQHYRLSVRSGTILKLVSGSAHHGGLQFHQPGTTYQYLKAKTLNKLLAATRIYLSRDQGDIRQMGEELGTSDEWEAKKYDAMYACTKRKFEQNPDLLKLLLDSGTCELVEATPNKL